MAAWQVVPRPKPQPKPDMSVTTGGRVSWSKDVWECLLGGPGSVELMIDSKRRLLGVRAVEDTAETGWPVKVETASCHIVANAGLKAMGIKIGKLCRGVVQVEDGIAHITLADAEIVWGAASDTG